ncbi:MAG: IPExxxVDY family protein [Marinoscillum sp.]
MNIKRSNIEFYADDFKVVGIVSNSKEYKIAWILNNLLNINLKKSDNILIKLINNKSISVSCLNYKDKKKYIRLLTNRLNNKENVKSYFISKLLKFDYLLQYSVNFFEFESFNIINELKRDNGIQFANFVDVNKLKEKYMLFI